MCADPEKAKYIHPRGDVHPKPWEVEVQSHIRGHKVPVAESSAFMVGTDSAGVAAAIHYGFVGQDEKQFLIWAIATACRARRKGHAKAALSYALDSCAATKAKYGLDCGIFTRIDPRNEASQALFKSFGFEYVTLWMGLEIWVRDV